MAEIPIYLTEKYRNIQKSLHVEDESVGDKIARIEVMISLPYLKPEYRVLDIGCKTGVEQEVWREHGILHTVGLDLYPEKAAAKGLTVVASDMHSLPFIDGSFDFIYCRDTLEHSPAPALVLDEMYRVLKPGGKALISVPVGHKAEYHFSVLSADEWIELWKKFGSVERLSENHSIQLVGLLGKSEM